MPDFVKKDPLHYIIQVLTLAVTLVAAGTWVGKLDTKVDTLIQQQEASDKRWQENETRMKRIEEDIARIKGRIGLSGEIQFRPDIARHMTAGGDR